MSTSAIFPSLPPRYDRSLRDVTAWIEGAFAPRAIVVSGSIVCGDADRGSDFDIVVVHEHAWRQRVQRLALDVPCEIFINPAARLRRAFVDEHANGRAVMAHMLATGWTVLDRDGIVPALRDEAQAWLTRPPTTSQQRLTEMRYRAVDLVDNARDVVARDAVTAAWIAGMAVEPILMHWLLAQRRLVPRAKDLMATVRALDAGMFALVERACGHGQPAMRVEATCELAQRCLGVSGFFAWESEPEPC